MCIPKNVRCKDINLWEVEISKDETHHVYRGKPLYNKRFKKVLSYHPPGVAAVLDETGAYHIDLCGNPLYPQRYIRTYGYYEEIATVVDEQGYTHIDLRGRKIHNKHFAWAGNFQDGLCVVRDWDGTYYHIDKHGKPAYSERYAYAGDFRHSVAVVYDFDGNAYHIDKQGRKVHNRTYFELYPYHKGVAVARDQYGYFHIDKNGVPLYNRRFRYVENYYNDYALAWEHDGSMVIIDYNGNVVHRITDNSSSAVVATSRRVLMGMMISYWHTKIIYTIARLGILDQIAEGNNTFDALISKLGIPEKCLKMLLDYLRVYDFIERRGNRYVLKALGRLLLEDYEGSLKYAALMWGDEHYLVMHRLYEAITSCSEQFSKMYGVSYYEYLRRHKEKYKIFTRAMAAYSDSYDELIKYMDIPKDVKRVIDVGGGSGVLLCKILTHYPTINEGIVFDQPEIKDYVVKDPRIRFVKGNFFEKIPLCDVDAAILSRVLHDWPDQEACIILCNTNKVMRKGGYLYIFELIKPDDPIYDLGVSLEFDLLAMLGSKERNLYEYKILLEKTGYELKRVVRGEVISLIIAIKREECDIATCKCRP